MKNPLIVSVLALVLSAVGLAVALTRAPSDTSVEPGAALPAPAGPDAELLARVEILSEENRALRDRLAMLEARPDPSLRAPAAGFVPVEDFEAFRDEVRGALESLSSETSLASSIQQPEFKEQLAGTLLEIRRAEAVAAVDAKRQRRLDRLDDRMVTFQAKLGLTARQSSELRSAIEARYEWEADLERRWREGEDPVVLGEVKSTGFQEHQEALTNILSPEQLETYWQIERRGAEGK